MDTITSDGDGCKPGWERTICTQSDYAWRKASDCQRAWSWLLFSIPIITIVLGGLVWPYDSESELHVNFQPNQGARLSLWILSSIMMGLVWQQLYVMKSNHYVFHLLMAAVITLIVVWFAVYHGAEMREAGAAVIVCAESALIVLMFLVATLSDIPEWAFGLFPMLTTLGLLTSVNEKASELLPP